MKLNFKIMDYKEKYENGLECIQEILSGAGDLIRTSTLRKRLQPFFPELQENKDDRIRNGLIKAVSGILKGNTLYGTDVTREEALAWLEKQSTPKDIDMPGLKPSDLKPGTWIVHNTLGTCKIVCLNVTIFGSGYEVVSCNDGIKHFIGFDEESDSCSLSNCHLWTINDAKDGDVLVNGANIFIFHFINNKRLMGYCHVNMNDGNFYNDIGTIECFGTIDAPVTPATKEQRNLLFQKMKEADYEWDAEKKELKRLS